MEKKEEENKIILDGQEVTKDQLSEALENKATRIVEKNDGSFITLKKLKG